MKREGPFNPKISGLNNQLPSLGNYILFASISSKLQHPPENLNF